MNPSVTPLSPADQAAAENAGRQFPDPEQPHATGPTAIQVALWRPGRFNGKPAAEYYAKGLAEAVAELDPGPFGCYSPAYADCWHDQNDLRQWLADLPPHKREEIDAEGWRIGTVTTRAQLYPYPLESLG